MPTTERDAKPVSDTLVTVARFQHATNAHLYRQRLEIEGIQCFLHDEVASRVVHAGAALIGGIKLQVRESDVPRLRKLMQIDPELAGPAGIEAASLDTPEACPECGGEEITRAPVSILRILLLLMGAGSNKPKWKCGDCRHRWYE